MEMAQGRFFSPDFPPDTAAIIINEETEKVLEWDNAVGKKISIWGQFEYVVIGVLKDFHYELMHQAVMPMGLITYPFLPIGVRFPGMAAVKISGENPQETIRFREEQWNKLAHGIPFSFSFLDSDYQALYNNEIKTGNVFLLYSVLAILIASMGFFALSSYTESGFTALPNGLRFPFQYTFSDIGFAANWWSSDVLIQDKRYAWYRELGFEIKRDGFLKEFGIGVRCLKDGKP